MQVLASILPNFIDIYKYAVLFIAKGGWLIFVIGFIVMFYHEYLEEVQGQFVRSIEWVFLELHVPKENLTSTLAVEHIFTQMHALHRSLTFMEKYIEGQFQMWYSLELVSFGGKVSYIMRVPKRYQHLVESAFYSQYPGAEIHEVHDYMEKFNFDPYKVDSPYDFFGTEWKMTEDSVIPIKTYKDFEHPSAEEKIIDPLAGTIEALERLGPTEFMSLQILIQPIQNDEWEGKAHSKIKELIGEEAPHEFSILGLLAAPFNWFAKFSYTDLLKPSPHAEDAPRQQKNNWLSMTDGEKKRVTLIEEKINKANYQSKIRLMYIAPKVDFDKVKRFEVIGALRHLSPGGGAGIHNTLKTERSTWTKVDALISPGLEKPFLEHETKRRKYWFLRGYRNRSMYVGSPKFLLSSEELATIFHFPITGEGGFAPAGVQAVQSKTARAPANLPVAEF